MIAYRFDKFPKMSAEYSQIGESHIVCGVTAKECNRLPNPEPQSPISDGHCRQCSTANEYLVTKATRFLRRTGGSYEFDNSPLAPRLNMVVATGGKGRKKQFHIENGVVEEIDLSEREELWW